MATGAVLGGSVAAGTFHGKAVELDREMQGFTGESKDGKIPAFPIADGSQVWQSLHEIDQSIPTDSPENHEIDP